MINCPDVVSTPPKTAPPAPISAAASGVTELINRTYTDRPNTAIRFRLRSRLRDRPGHIGLLLFAAPIPARGCSCSSIAALRELADASVLHAYSSSATSPPSVAASAGGCRTNQSITWCINWSVG